jgi:acid phosphatase type 7
MRPKAFALLALSTLTLGVAFACMEHPDAALQPSEVTADAVLPAILLAAGDIAGCPPRYDDEETAEMIADLPGTIALLGDVVYEDATETEFRKCYNPTWGRVLSRSRPAPGNHEYRTPGAAAYYKYFGSKAGPVGKGYYTYTMKSWRIYALNSERLIPEQTAWLKAHLAANKSKCILAYWHKPLYTSGHEPVTPEVKPLFDALYKAGAEVVLTGHNHNYERFAPQDAEGNLKPRGTRQFVVGTGGAELEGFITEMPNSKLRYADDRGVLRLSLHPGRYGWKFLPLGGGESPDTGYASCT